MGITLRGLTWDHPRGYAPLLGGVPEYRAQHPEIDIHWDRRSLREFGEAPIEQYLDRYDLFIVDHPFVGFAAAHGVLLDLAPSLTEAEKSRFAQNSVGLSWESYWYSGGLWAFPIDAATQVASHRLDLLSALHAAVPDTFDGVLELGAKARNAGKYIVVPACPTDAISLFFTLSANLGYPIPEERELFIDDLVAAEVLDRLHALITLAHPNSLDWNPIQTYDFMIGSSDAVYCPYGFGYSNYSRVSNPVRLKFANAPGAGQRGFAGTMLGGTGIAVSKFSRQPSEAIGYAKWLVSPEHQRGTYFREGGQPASLAAWTDPSVNALADGFFAATLPTLQTAYVRPRFDGFVRFFEAAGVEINRCLRGQVKDQVLIRWLNDRYATQRVAASCSASNRVVDERIPVKNPNPDPAKHKEIPIWNAEDWLYEDFEVGQRARSVRRTISEGESMLFNAMVLDMHPYVADDVFAKEEGIFHKRLVAGAMVFSLGLGLMAHNNIHTFSYGYDKLRFIKPVFVGDTIYTIRTQLEKWPRYAELGMVRVSYEVFKMPGELVLYCEHLQTVKYREPAKFKDQLQQK